MMLVGKINRANEDRICIYCCSSIAYSAFSNKMEHFFTKRKNKGDKDAEDLLEKLNQSNERMIRLIDDLLNVTRIEEGRYIYKPVPRDIVQIIESVIVLRVEAAKRKGIDFLFNKPKEKIPEVKVDEEKISIVIQNLVENAINYTPSGGKILVSIIYQRNARNIS